MLTPPAQTPGLDSSGPALAAGRLERWLLYGLLAMALAALLALEDLFNDGESLAATVRELPPTFLSLFVSLAAGNTFARAVLRRSAARPASAGERLAREAAAMLAYSLVAALLLRLLYWAVSLCLNSRAHWGTAIAEIVFVSLIINAVIFSSAKYQWLRGERDALRLHAAQLEKESVELQYKALQRQVNPHFLFNSLNALSALIYQDVALADAYIKEFARVFRYVLEMNDEPVVTVRQELAFLNSYIFMQQIRFGASLRMELQVGAETLNALIPPLSLQLLAENALKHNIVSKADPLTLHLTTDGEHLVLTNNYQPRIDCDPSTGVGLRNLAEKYRLISTTMPEFGLRGAQYVARLPLIHVE
jgi:two-component system, LytTR family, sensor kinase